MKMDLQTGDKYAKFLGGPEVPDPTARSEERNVIEKVTYQAMLWLQKIKTIFKNDRAPQAASFSLPPL